MAITNGTFDTDLSGWEIYPGGNATIIWESPGRARLDLPGTGPSDYEMYQNFVIDDIAVYFQYRCTGNDVYNHWPMWSLTVDGIQIINENLNNTYSGIPLVTWTRVVDVSGYIGSNATISFYDSDPYGGTIQTLQLDNIGVGKAGSVDFITDPPGASIWLKNLDGEWEEQWTYLSDGYKNMLITTPFTISQMISQDYILKPCGCTDYTDTLVMTGPTATVDVMPSPTPYTTVNIETYPSGAEIYVDGIDTGIMTPGIVTLPPTSSCVHTFTFRRSGYFDYMRTDTLLGQGPITISANMVPLIPTPICP